MPNDCSTEQVLQSSWSPVNEEIPCCRALPYFDAFCDLLLYRLAETWNLFVLYDKKNVVYSNVIYARTDQNAPQNSAYHMIQLIS